MISKTVNGNKSPSLDLIDRLAHALEMDPLRMLENTELLGRYAAERVNPQTLSEYSDTKIVARRERLAQPLMAIKLIYDAICDIDETFTNNSYDAFVESRCMYLREQLHWFCSKAKDDLHIDVSRGFYVPHEDDPDRYADVDRAIQYSRAKILKEIIPYEPLAPEVYHETSQRIGLTRIKDALAAHKVRQQQPVASVIDEDVLDEEMPW